MASGPFKESYEAVKRVEDTVNSRLDDAFRNAEYLRAHAMSAISGLKDPSLDIGDPGEVPLPPDLSLDFDFDFELPKIDPTSFGTITGGSVQPPVLDPLPNIKDIDIPEFNPSVKGLDIPNSPTVKDHGALPEAPDRVDIPIPVAPDLQLPSPPILEDLQIPKFAGVTIPEFNVDDPEFEGTPLPTGLHWDEPTYKPEIIGDVVFQIRKLWDGGSGLPPAVEDAMWQRAAERENVESNKVLAEVDVEFSRRGFFLPSGLLAARKDQIRTEAALRKNSLHRDITIQVAQWQVENIRFAVEQGIAAENVFVNLFDNAANRLLEAAKTHVDAQLRIYDAKVAIFNANIQKMQIKAAVFEAKVRAELSKLDVFKAEIEATIAKGQINDNRIRTYEAMIRTVVSSVEIYKAKMQGANIQADIARTGVESYKAEVQAYAEAVRADKVRFDAYESQVRGEAAKGGIIDAEARAYAAIIQGKIASGDIDVKRLDAVVRSNSARIEEFRGYLDLEKTRIQSQLATIDASAKAYTADTQRFVAMAQAQGEKAKLGVTAKEAEIRTNVAFYQAQIQAYVSRMEMMIKQAQLALDAIRSAGQLSSTLAAGAMAGVSVGASLSGQAGVAASGSEQNSNSKSYSEQKSFSENHNYNS